MSADKQKIGPTDALKLLEGVKTLVCIIRGKNIVTFDEERKAAMVSNLLVVLCGEAEVHPVINAGTLYN